MFRLRYRVISWLILRGLGSSFFHAIKVEIRRKCRGARAACQPGDLEDKNFTRSSIYAGRLWWTLRRPTPGCRQVWNGDANQGNAIRAAPNHVPLPWVPFKSELTVLNRVSGDTVCDGYHLGYESTNRKAYETAIKPAVHFDRFTVGLSELAKTPVDNHI